MRDLQIDWLKCFLAVVDNRAVASPIPTGSSSNNRNFSFKTLHFHFVKSFMSWHKVELFKLYF